jgi:hypothetical protein
MPTGEDFMDLPEVAPCTVLISSRVLITTSSSDGFVVGVEDRQSGLHSELIFRAQNSADNLIDAFRVHQIDQLGAYCDWNVV